MILGKSVHHVEQGKGKIYSVDKIAGYYNDLTEKITRFGKQDVDVPKTFVDTGEEIYFSIPIFQYGLAAYDLYLLNSDKTMLKKTLACADWAVDNQNENGSFTTFEFKDKNHPYSSMAQGEAISLLIRAHLETNNDKYIDAAKKALDFMLVPKSEGGVCEYTDDGILLYEFTGFEVVLNGWIFSLWGIFDYCKYTNDDKAKQALLSTLSALEKRLPSYDIKYWSKYDGGKNICSPFYHKLHIAQLEAMHELFGDEIYKEYADKWSEYQNSFFKPKRAFIKKSLQKIFER